MAEEKMSFEQFWESTDESSQAFVQDLHSYMLANGCKGTFEQKKSGPFASYKHIKSKKSILNLLRRKKGTLVRIYGENTGEYHDVLNTLPEEMLAAIGKAGICKRLVENTCSPKCTGYDFTIGGERYQKCRYGCFEFLITKTSIPYIKSFVEGETKARATV